MKRRNFIPYSRQRVIQEDIDAVVNVLKSDFLTQGPIIGSFEEKVCKKVDADYAVSTNSATSALHLSCLALGLKRGDYLWTSPITFVASANCARYCGADVDFVDIDENTGLLSINKLKKKLEAAEKAGKLPKILVPVHLTGSSCNMVEIKKLSDKYKFHIIEDASHAIGGKYKNEPVGNCKYSEITIFSFHPVKIITSGEGGLATTNSKSIYEKLISLRSHGITKDSKKFKKFPNDIWFYEQQDLGLNYRMTDISAALGLSQLKRLDEIVFERNRQHLIYKDLFMNTPINILSVPKEVYSSFHLQVVQLNDKNIKNYQKVFQGLRELGIGVQLHYIPVHTQPYYQDMGFREGMFPISEQYSAKSLSIPLFPGLKEEEQYYIRDKLLELIS